MIFALFFRLFPNCVLLGLITDLLAGSDISFISTEKIPENMNEFALWGLIILELIKTGAYIYGLYVLRKLIRSFFRNKLYTKLQIASLNLSGRLICLSVILGAVSEFLKKMILDNRITLNFGMEFSFSSFWIILAFGIFLIFLAKVFQNARQLKKENELTI